MTIDGTGLGLTQGSGQVWLGTTYGSVTSWGDTQIIAQVALGSLSGKAQVLQNGVWSNAVQLMLNTPTLTSMTLAPNLLSR